MITFAAQFKIRLARMRFVTSMPFGITEKVVLRPVAGI